MITKEDLTITGIDSVLAITDCQLEAKPNHHASCLVKCSVSDELLYQALHEQILSIRYDKDGAEELLFRGVLDRYEQERKGNYLEVSLWMLSGSIWLNHQKHTRAFQNTDQSYEMVIRNVLASQSGTDVLFAVNNKEKQPIQDLIVQYQESDWNFIKRMASHLNSVVVPDIRSGQPKLYIGCPEGTTIDDDLKFHDCTISIDKRFHEKQTHSLPKDCYLFYRVESGSRYPVGARVNVKGRTLSVLSCSARLLKGEMVFSYEIGFPVLYKTDRYYNDNLTGAALMGTVMETDAQSVKVLFDVDPNEADAVAVESCRNNDMADCSNISSAADRYFTTTGGKELKLVSESIGLDGHTGNSFVIDDQKGISFHGKKMELEAKGKMILKGNKIQVSAPLQATLLKGTMTGGSINICQDFNTSGKVQFLANAAPYQEEEPVRLERTVEIGEIGQLAAGMIPTGKSNDYVVDQALGMLVQGKGRSRQ